MANEGNVVLSIGVDVSEGKAALAGLADAGESAGKRTAAGMAPAAKGVDAVGDGAQAAAGKLKGLGEAGGEVGKRIGDGLQPAIAGMGGLGDETVHTEEKLNKATTRIINQLERQTAAIKDGGTRGAESYAVMAKQQGASIAAIEPYIAALERAKEAAKNIAVPVAPVVSDFEKMAAAAGLPLDAIQKLNASFGAEIGAGKAAADAEKVRESMLRMGEAAGMSEVRMREYAASLGMSADQIAARFDRVVPVVVSDFERMAAAAGLPAEAIQKLNASFGAEIGAGKAAADAEKVRESMLRMGEAAGMSEVRMREYAASLGMSADQIAARFDRVVPVVVSDFERMAAAAGLPAEAIQKLNASFGAEIGAGKAAADAEKVRESMLRMGEAAGMSEVRMREYAASLGMSADQIAARFDRVVPVVVSDFERMAAAAGLPADAIQKLNASFGGKIADAQSLSAIEHARTRLMSMGVAAGFSASALHDMGASIGMTAKETEAHTRHISGGLARMAEASGMSMAQLQNGMRMIPMQMTDIVTSLASGMPPWMVFIQQGGQLKDTLGGTSMALRAVATYVVGLINPLTVAAVAVGVLALAYNQGSKEADAYRLALVNTGNAAGTTTGQMAGMARHVSDSVGTTGAAAEALTALAATGRVAGDDMEKFATAALWAQKGLGTGVEETAKRFEELGKSPAEASAKLNESLNYLTASTYRQIRAAEEAGDKEGAAAIAQNAYSEAIEARGKKMIAAMGWIEKAAMSAAGGAKSMWDAILDIGREEDPTAKAAAAAVKLLDLRAKLQSGNYGGTGNEQYDRAVIESQIAGQERLIASTQKKAAAENAAAKSQAESAAAERRKIEWDKRVQAGLPPEERAKRDIKTIRAEGRLAGGTSDEINALVAVASKPLTDKAQQSANERLKIEIDYYKQLTDEVKSGEKLMQSALSAERSAGLIGEVDYFNRRKTLSDNALVDQQASIELEIEEIKRSGIAQKDKATQIAALNNQIAGLERERVAIAQQAEIDIAAARRKEIQALATESIGIQSAALESWNKLALVKDADYYENAAQNTAKYQQEKANLALQTYLNESRYAVQGSQVEIDARQKMIKVVRDIGLERELASKNAIASAYEYGRTVDSALEKQAYESSLILQTSEERTKLLAIYDIEAAKLEKIRQIMAATPAGKARDESIAGIEVAAAKAKQGEVSKVLNAEWKTHLDFAEGIAKGIWDDYTSGAGNAAQNALNKIKKELFDELYKYALKPLVLNVVANITGNPVGGAAAAMGGGGGGGVSGTLTSMAGKALGGVEVGGATLGAWGGGISSGFTAGLGGKAASFMGPTLPGFEAGAMLGEAIPYVGAAVAAYKIIDSFSDKNEKKGGNYSYDAASGAVTQGITGTNGVELGNAKSQTLIQDGIKAATATTNALLKAAGSSVTVLGGEGMAQWSSEKPESYAGAYLKTSTGVVAGKSFAEVDNNLGMADVETVIKKYEQSLNEATADAIIKVTDIPESAKTAISKIDTTLGAEAFASAVEAVIETSRMGALAIERFGESGAAVSTQLAAAWLGFDAAGLGKMMTDAAFNPAVGMSAAKTFGIALGNSVQQSLLNNVMGQVQAGIYNSIVLPILAGQEVSQAATDAVVNDAVAKMDQLAALLDSESFKGVIDRIAASTEPVLASLAQFAPVSELNSYTPDTSSASNSIADAAKKEADEKKSLQDKLDALTMTRAQLLTKERDAVSESNRALFDQLKAREAFDAANKLAQAELAKQAGLQVDLIEAQGDSVTAMEMRRVAAIKAATEGMNDYNAELVSGAMIATNALEDQVNAAKALQSISSSLNDKFGSLQVDLLTAQGDEAGAKQLKRQQELNALLAGKSDADAAEITNLYNRNAAIEDQIDVSNKAKKAAEDAQKAWEDSQKAWEDSQKAARDTAKASEDAWKNIRTSLEDEVKKLRGDLLGNTAQGLAAAQSEFTIAQAQAKAGDQKAAEKLPQLAEKIVEIAKGMGMTGSALRQVTGETAASLEASALATQAQIDQYHAQATAPVQAMPPASVFGGTVSVGAQVAGPIIIPVNQSSQNVDLNPSNQAMMKTLGDVLGKIETMTSTVASAVSSKAVQQVQVVGPVRTV